MKYKPEQEKQLLTDILGFSHDPEGFVEYVYPWGEPGTPLEHATGPRGWQREVLQEARHQVASNQFALDNDLLESLSIFKLAIASGRGIGKSAEFGMLTNWMLSTHIGSSVIVTANTETQLRTKTFAEFGRWFTLPLNAHWWDAEGLAVRPATWLAKMVEDQLRIDTQYWGATGQNWSEENPEAFAGVHNSYGLAVFFDEASGIPEKIWEVTEGFFTERTAFRTWIVFSNPRRNAGAFYDRFDPGSPKSQEWRTKQIDARTVEGSDQSVYESIIRTYGEGSDTARVEVYGQFPEQGEGQLIPNSVVREAQQRRIPPAVDTDEPLIMGVDPAPRGRTVIRFRQGRDARSIPRVVLQGADNEQIADKCVELVNEHNPDGIVVDAGNGTGVIDILKRKGVKVFEVWFGAGTGDKEDEFALWGGKLWARMRDWLPGGSIDDAPELFADLTKRTWRWFGGREDGQKMLTPKRETEKDGIPSPDDGDALCLTFYSRLPRRSKRARRGRGPDIAAGTGECELG